MSLVDKLDILVRHFALLPSPATIIALGLELGLQVVAEGIETPEQSAFVLSHGYRTQQGFLFSRPVPATEFGRLLRDGLPAQQKVSDDLQVAIK